MIIKCCQQLALHPVASDIRVYWSGRSGPRYADLISTVLLENEISFREDARLHGTFGAVYLVEEEFGVHSHWPLVLDEALRLFCYGKRGFLVLRLVPQGIGILELATYIQKRPDASFSIFDQRCEEDGSQLVVITCDRHPHRPTLQSLGFGIVSDGGRPEELRRFVDSALNVEHANELIFKIALCGPSILRQQIASVVPPGCWSNIIFLPEPNEHRHKGWITRKKNLLVNALPCENIVVAHDRYEVPSNFIEKLRLFGPDFDVVVPAQTRLGASFPDWTATAADWKHTKTYWLPYGSFSFDVYVNGGVVLGKRDVLSRHPWNEMLFWNQKEDIEQTRRFISNGITPRIAPNLRLEVTAARVGYEQGFEKTGLSGLPMPTQNMMPLNVLLDLRSVRLETLEDHGIIVWTQHWLPSKNGIVSIGNISDFTLCNGCHGATHVRLRFIVSAKGASSIGIHINGARKSYAPDLLANGYREFRIALAEIPAGAGGQITLAIAGEGEVLTGVQLERATRLVTYPVKVVEGAEGARGIFGPGWWASESWGTWSSNERSSLTLPLPSPDKNSLDLKIILRLKTLPGDGRGSKVVGLSCNGVPMANVSIMDDGKPRSFALRIPHSVAALDSHIVIEFIVISTTSPAEIGCSSDQRKIGFGLIFVDLRRTRLWSIGKSIRSFCECRLI